MIATGIDSTAARLNPTDTLVTLDVDWAPDWMIEDVAERLVLANVRATFFATHDSPAIRALIRNPLFEIGLHPNFLSGSSHGNTPDEIFKTLRSFLPEARSMRTHSLFQSEPLLGLCADRYNIEIDCSIHLPRVSHICPQAVILTDGGRTLVRVPHIFQDNMHIISNLPWTFSAIGLMSPGWKVLNFHPVHVILNSSSLQPYEALKVRGPLQTLTRADLPAVRADEPGTGALFDQVLAVLKGRETHTVSTRVQLWKQKSQI